MLLEQTQDETDPLTRSSVGEVLANLSSKIQASPVRKNVTHYMDDAIKYWSPLPSAKQTSMKRSKPKRMQDSIKTFHEITESKLATGVAKAIGDHTVQCLQSCSSCRVTRFEFNNILTKIGIFDQLNARDLKYLQEKYSRGNDGTYDLASFKADALSLGRGLHEQISEKEKRDLFYRKMESLKESNGAISRVGTAQRRPEIDDVAHVAN